MTLKAAFLFQFHKRKGSKYNPTWAGWQKKKQYILIHLADPHSRPIVIIIFAHVSVHTSVKNIAKQKKQRVKIMIVSGGTVGLAEGIIDDTCVITKLELTHRLIWCKKVNLFSVALFVIFGACVLIQRAYISNNKITCSINFSSQKKTIIPSDKDNTTSFKKLKLYTLDIVKLKF